MKTLLLILIFVSSAAFAKDDSCESLVTVDHKFEKLKASGVSLDEATVPVTHLLSEAFTPYFKDLNVLVHKMTREQIREMAEEIRPQRRSHFNSNPLPPFAKESGLNASFEGSFDFSRAGVVNRQEVPFTKFSRQTAERLALAVQLTHDFTFDLLPAVHHPSMAGSELLRGECSFAGDEIDTAMYFAFLSIGEGVAALIADQVEGWSADQMLRNVVVPHGKMPSAAVLFSLMLPPRLLGQHGGSDYFANPLEDRNGTLVMTQDFKDHLKRNRDYYQKNIARNVWEFGHGCPVGHLMKGEQRSGVQYALDAVLYVYEALE